MVHLAVEPSLRKRIDDYRFDHRFPSKTAAWKWLVWAAMEAGLQPTPEQIAEMEDGEAPWNR